MTTKIVALTDVLRNLVRFQLLPGHRYQVAECICQLDRVCAEPLMKDVRFDDLIADMAFASDTIINDLNKRGAKIVISQHSRRSRPLLLHRDLYRWRHLVENFFYELKDSSASP